MSNSSSSLSSTDAPRGGDSARIEDKLREAWRREQRFVHLRGASRFLVWLVVLIGLDFLIDWGILARTGASAKFGYLLPVMNVAVLLWVLWHEWLRHLRRYDPLRVALEVESRHPELSSVLVSYTQLEGTVEKQPNVSRDLIEAMRGEAVLQTRSLDFREIVDFGQLRNLLFVTVGSLLLFGAISINWREHVGTLFQRLLGAEVEYPTRTQVVDVTGDLLVRLGDPVTVSARAAGVIPEAGEILTRPIVGDPREGGAAENNGAWQSLPMKRSQNTPTYTRELKELTTDLVYYVRLGDDESEPRRITVVPSPRVVAARLTLVYPAYMDRDPSETDQLNVEVPEGTEIRWQLTCAPRVKRLEVRADDRTLEATLDENGERAAFALRADDAFKYTFHWTERESGQDFEYDDVQYTVRVVADLVPEVELIRPAASGLATVKKTLEIEARAVDDLGLSTAWLVYSVDGSAEERFPIHDFGGADRKTFQATWKLAEKIDGLKPGMRIMYGIEVGDRHPSGVAHRRRSVTRQLTIVEPERYLQWYRGELAAQNDLIRRALEAEKTSSVRVKELKAQEGESP